MQQRDEWNAKNSEDGDRQNRSAYDRPNRPDLTRRKYDYAAQQKQQDVANSKNKEGIAKARLVLRAYSPHDDASPNSPSGQVRYKRNPNKEIERTLANHK